MYLDSLITSFCERLDLAICEDVMKLKQAVSDVLNGDVTQTFVLYQLLPFGWIRSLQVTSRNFNHSSGYSYDNVRVYEVDAVCPRKIRPYRSTPSATPRWRDTWTILPVWLA